MSFQLRRLYGSIALLLPSFVWAHPEASGHAGFFHELAHATEAVGVRGLAYLVGMLLAAGALHAVGFAACAKNREA